MLCWKRKRKKTEVGGWFVLVQVGIDNWVANLYAPTNHSHQRDLVVACVF